MFKRAIDGDLDQWIVTPNRKPLIIRGARQVGKSTIVRQFAETHGFKLVEINLERHPQLNDSFASLNLDNIFLELDSIAGRSIRSLQRPLLFLDEIQATPAALAALRYFYEDMPKLPVIAAGSLLEFALADFNYSMPVGRIEYRYMGPVSFEEFLAASGQNFLLGVISDICRDFSKLSDHAHQQLLMAHRQFLFVGGMPEAVERFITTRDPTSCQSIQQSLIDTFEDDLAKYSTGGALLRLRKVYRQLPLQVGNKIKYVNFSKDDKARDIKSALDKLAMAQIWYPVHHSDAGGCPLGAERSEETRKLLFIDIGLMNRALNLQWTHVAKLSDRALCNEGVLAEQYVGQELLYRRQAWEKPSLFYWLREKKSGNAEVDYVIDDHQFVIPIEVKSGKSGTLRSLENFVGTRKSPLAVRFDLNKPSVQDAPYRLLSLPLYLASRCSEIVGRLI